MPLLLSLVVFFLALMGIGAYYLAVRARSRRHPYGDWEELIRRIRPVDRGNLAAIALAASEEAPSAEEGEGNSGFELSEIWQMIGGSSGLESLERNCLILVDLVFYVQRWYPEALGIAEQLRLNAREIQWHIKRLRAAEEMGKPGKSFPENTQRVAALYYQMTRQVLALYEKYDLPELEDLRAAL